jgi:hypothetical protein
MIGLACQYPHVTIGLGRDSWRPSFVVSDAATGVRYRPTIAHTVSGLYCCHVWMGLSWCTSREHARLLAAQEMRAWTIGNMTQAEGRTLRDLATDSLRFNSLGGA